MFVIVFVTAFLLVDTLQVDMNLLLAPERFDLLCPANSASRTLPAERPHLVAPVSDIVTVVLIIFLAVLAIPRPVLA